MNPSEGFDRLQLDKHYPSHEKIRPKALIKSLPTKVNGNRLLPLDGKSTLPQSVCKQNFVNRFEQSRTHLLVNLERTVDDMRSNTILIHLKSSLRSLRALREKNPTFGFTGTPRGLFRAKDAEDAKVLNVS